MKWIDAKENPPKKEGRYFILTSFQGPCISNNSIIRENVPFVSNFTLEKGWMSVIAEQTVNYWMEIPPSPKSYFCEWGGDARCNTSDGRVVNMANELNRLEKKLLLE